jgi:hypothetical protein
MMPSASTNSRSLAGPEPKASFFASSRALREPDLFGLFILTVHLLYPLVAHFC